MIKFKIFIYISLTIFNYDIRCIVFYEICSLVSNKKFIWMVYLNDNVIRVKESYKIFILLLKENVVTGVFLCEIRYF